MDLQISKDEAGIIHISSNGAPMVFHSAVQFGAGLSGENKTSVKLPSGPKPQSVLSGRVNAQGKADFLLLEENQIILDAQAAPLTACFSAGAENHVVSLSENQIWQNFAANASYSLFLDYVTDSKTITIGSSNILPFYGRDKTKASEGADYWLPHENQMYSGSENTPILRLYVGGLVTGEAGVPMRVFSYPFNLDLFAVVNQIGRLVYWPHQQFDFDSQAEGSICSSYLKTDGKAYDAVKYPILAQALGGMYGLDGGKFFMPDHRGLFPRIWAEGSQQDPDRESRSDRGDGSNGDILGSIQEDQLKSHNHGLGTCQHDGFTRVDVVDRAGGAPNTKTVKTHTAGGAETRPKNYSVAETMLAWC